MQIRRREQHPFVKRTMSGGTAMLILLLALSVLSIRLFLAQQRASRNAQLALDASAEILHLIAPDPSAPSRDPSIREVRVRSAIAYLETLRIDDPENLKCLTGLRTLYVAFGGLLLDRNQITEAQAIYKKAEAMVIPISLSRLRAWEPTGRLKERDLSLLPLSLPDNDERNRLQTLMAIAEDVNSSTSVQNALDYAELVAEYLPLIDTSTKSGRTEARRVLQLSLKKFQEAGTSEPLSTQLDELVAAIKRAFDLLASYD